MGSQSMVGGKEEMEGEERRGGQMEREGGSGGAGNGGPDGGKTGERMGNGFWERPGQGRAKLGMCFIEGRKGQYK